MMCTRMMMTMMTTVVLAATGAAPGDQIVLRDHATIDAETETIRLAHVARLRGPHAAALADRTVATLAPETMRRRLSITAVRRALDESGVHWGRLELSGRDVLIVRHTSAGPGTVTALAAADITGDAPSRPTAATAGAGGSAAWPTPAPDALEALIIQSIAARLGVSPDRVRARFEQEDASYLERSRSEYRFELIPLSSTRSARMTMRVRCWRGDELVDGRTMSVVPQLRMPVVETTAVVRRGAELTPDVARTTERWVSPARLETLVDASTAMHRRAASTLDEGEVVTTRQLERMLLVERGDAVEVTTISGTLSLTAPAIALSDGHEGETIRFRHATRSFEFEATVTGPGAATKTLGRR